MLKLLREHLISVLQYGAISSSTTTQNHYRHGCLFIFLSVLSDLEMLRLKWNYVSDFRFPLL